ncbi:MAG TPA: PqqD family protein [Streptomyces sp.]|jgi:hypothetical protein|uniref:PqqD family protein n=1 Tax=Streptomyces sp. TaxID=1931 RepID=UPI002CA1D821|nr:PqqD family protein [Streptomyces sp.]HWU11151.1 PqqD family protein [Streptomyces sp.]
MRLRAEGLSARELSGEIILLDLRSSRYLSVSGVGVDIVNLLSVDRTEEELIAAVLEQYEVDEATVRRDALTFLGQLRDAGLLE